MRVIPVGLGLCALLACCGCLDDLFAPRNAPIPPTTRPITIQTAPQATPASSLELYIVIDTRGFTVGSPNAVLTDPDSGEVPTIPCKEEGCPTTDSYDYTGLTETMVQVKNEYPDEQQVIIRAEASIKHEVVVLTLDAVRSQGDRELFPEVVFSIL